MGLNSSMLMCGAVIVGHVTVPAALLLLICSTGFSLSTETEIKLFKGSQTFKHQCICLYEAGGNFMRKGTKY